MPTTSSPNYTEILPRPIWANGRQVDSMGQKRVVTGQDVIKAEDINNLREIVNIMYSHSHEYTDSKGSC